MDDELKKYLTELAHKECWGDSDFTVDNPFELSGGNYDDAYYGGVTTGRVELARELLHDFLGYIPALD